MNGDLALLLALPDAGTLGFWLLMAVCIGWGLLVVWCCVDSFNHTDMGCLWTVLMISPLGPLVVPFYFFGTMYARRNVSARKLAEMRGDGEEIDITRRFASEFERAKFIEAAERGGGTMYDPGLAPKEQPEGRQHFKDERAETLLKEGRHDEAWHYLIDLYSLASEDGDRDREETYRNYIARMPDGLARLRAWRRGDREGVLSPDEAPRRTITDSIAGRSLTEPGKRDLPF
jgi:hypothetical protein